MAEYNFWDDRTWGCDDTHWCPVVNDYCLDQHCNQCEEKKQFDAYYSQENREDK